MNKKYATASLLFFLVAATIFWVYRVTHQEQPPAPFRVELHPSMAASAEVRRSEEVSPGTFKIRVDMGELIKLLQDAKDPKPLAVYSIEAKGLKLEYWLPRDGGSFYYTKQSIRPPYLSWKYTVGKVEIAGRTLILHPEPALTVVFFAGMVIFCLSCGLCAVGAYTER